MRLEVLEGQFAELLGRMKFDDEVMEWVREALRVSHADQKHEHQVAVVRLKAEYDRLEKRIQAMYVDKLDARVDAVVFERMSAEWRAEQDRCLSQISGHQGAEQSYFEEGVRILELARNARQLFEKQEPRKKRRLIQFVVSNCTWKEGLLTAELRQPFDCVIKMASPAAPPPCSEEPKAAKA
jgi:site-specific DNA recombinase